MPCNPRPLRAEFLLEPTAVNEYNEVEKRHDSEWEIVARAYCKLETKGGREVLRAQQVHAEVNAIVEVDWTAELDCMTADRRIRVFKPNRSSETFEIKYKEDVDFANEILRFWCTATVT